MHTVRAIHVVGFAMLLSAQPAQPQSEPTDYRDEFLMHFERSMRKVAELARVVPQELYTWSPGHGVMTIAQVYTHIARYNFYYPETALGIAPPADIDVPNMESITDKARVRELVDRSIRHVRTSVKKMSAEDLTRATMLYGREIAGWAVLFQLLSHMNEHVGQSVAYARMNDIVPPWSS